MSGYGQVSKKATGAMFVEKEDLFEKFLEDDEPASSSADSVGARSMRSQADRSVRSTASKASKGSQRVRGGGALGGLGGDSLREASVASTGTSASDMKAKALLERARIRAIHKKDKEFAKLQDDLKQSLNFLDNVDRDLNLVNETKRTKTRRQFEDWNQNVHGAIQKNILTKLNGMKSSELHQRKLESYEQFLSITNRKPAIFRDIIIESEYDPLETNRKSIKAKTQMLKDPLNIDKQKAQAEMGMIGLSLEDDGHIRSDRLAVPQWAKGKIEATPYGMFATMMDDGDAKKEEDKNRKSNVVFDDFNYPKGKAAVDKEMPPPKPRTRKVYANPKVFYTDPKTGGPYPRDFVDELSKIKPPSR